MRVDTPQLNRPPLYWTQLPQLHKKYSRNSSGSRSRRSSSTNHQRGPVLPRSRHLILPLWGGSLGSSEGVSRIPIGSSVAAAVRYSQRSSSIDHQRGSVLPRSRHLILPLWGGSLGSGEGVSRIPIGGRAAAAVQ